MSFFNTSSSEYDSTGTRTVLGFSTVPPTFHPPPRHRRSSPLPSYPYAYQRVRLSDIGRPYIMRPFPFNVEGALRREARLEYRHHFRAPNTGQRENRPVSVSSMVPVTPLVHPRKSVWTRVFACLKR